MWLLLITPAAESLVGRWRAQHDVAARFGIPAHVTVRTPFLPPEHWRDPALSLLERFLPIDVTLSHLENRPGALVLVVKPDDGLREITKAVGLSWPTLPPHKANRADLAYHMTVVSDSEREHSFSDLESPCTPSAATRRRDRVVGIGGLSRRRSTVCRCRTDAINSSLGNLRPQVDAVWRLGCRVERQATDIAATTTGCVKESTATTARAFVESGERRSSPPLGSAAGSGR